MRGWQTEYINLLTNFTNERLLEEYGDNSNGDDYDGLYTTNGLWRWEHVKKELFNRLKEIGFFKED